MTPQRRPHEERGLLPREGGTVTLSRADGATDTPEGSEEGRTVGSYRILREVGQGGMGSVYLAHRDDDEFKKRVAIKLLRPGMATDDLVRRFRTERQILASIDHPHIARLLDGGTTEEGLPYFLMEYIEGEPIDRYCDTHRLSVAERLELFRTVCGAVQFAHQNLVVHRDLKPGNILVTTEGEVKLLDFGIAKLLHPELSAVRAGATRVEDRVMTPEYASPEQFRGDPVTTASDVYSLGVLLYELLSGHAPYRLSGLSLHEVSRLICEEDPRKPSTVIGESEKRTRADGTTEELSPESVSRSRETRPERLQRRLSGDLDAIVMKAMRKEPQRRYGSAEQLSEDVRRHLEGLPVRARKGTFRYTASKFVRRHRIGVAMASASVVFLVGFSVVLAVQSARIARERDRAEVEAAKARAVSEFLQETLASADPYEGQGRDVTVVEVLAAAAKEVEESFADQPEIDAAIRHTIGSTYASLGRLDEAEPWLRQALEMRQELLGTDHLDVAASMQKVARLLGAKGDYDGAERLTREALAVRQRVLGPASPEIAESLDSLAQALFEKGDYVAAETLHRDALAMRRELLGDGSLEVAESLNNLAVLLSRKGDYTGAEKMFRESLAIRRPLLGDEHPAVAESLNNLASVFGHQEDYDSAETLYRESLSLHRKVYGEAHPRVATALGNLAWAVGKKGDYGAAEPLHRETLAMSRTLLGDEHPDVALSLHNLAQVVQAQGDLEGAERLYTEALALERKVLGKQHPLLGATLSSYGSCLTQLKRHEKAEEHLLEAYSMQKAVLGEQHDHTQRTAGRMVQLYKGWGKPDKAAEYEALQSEGAGGT